MKKEMLINVLQPEECRIAIVEDGLLEELYVERSSQESYVGNIYKGRIVNIEASIQAAFVDFGIGRNGFLHVSDVDAAYYKHLLSKEDLAEYEAEMEREYGSGNGGRGRERGRGRDRIVRPVQTMTSCLEPQIPPQAPAPPDEEYAQDFAAGLDDEVPIAEAIEEGSEPIVPDSTSEGERASNFLGAEPDEFSAGIDGEATPVPPVQRPRVAELRPPVRVKAAPVPMPEDDEEFGAGIVEESASIVVPPTPIVPVVPAPWLESEPIEPEPPVELEAVATTPPSVEESAHTEASGEQEDPLADETEAKKKNRSRKPRARIDEASDTPPEPGDPSSEGKNKSRSRRGRKKAEGEAEKGGDADSGPKYMGGAERRTSAGDDEPEIRPFFDDSNGGFDPDAPNDRFAEPPGATERLEIDHIAARDPESAESAEEDARLEAQESEEFERFAPAVAEPVSEEPSIGRGFNDDFAPRPSRRDREDRGRGRGGRDRGVRDRDRSPRNFRDGGKGGRDRGLPKPPIEQIFKRGQEVIVQVIKEAVGTKGPTLSTYISIAGRYLVLMPSLNRVGVSRKIEDHDARRRLREIMNTLAPPKGVGFIVRTAAIDRDARELRNDLAYLLRLWQVVVKRIKRVSGPVEIYRESDMITRTIRDIFTNDIDTIWVDEPIAFAHASEFLQIVMPKFASRIRYFESSEPLFHKYGVEDEIAKIHQKRIEMPLGGSLVIEQTEALVAIDVNSGNFRADNNAEETAYQMNLHAAKEIARQLRLRDLGGVIVNDFIDMKSETHRRRVEDAFRDALRRDRARTKILRISQFGLIEMTRQRIRPSLKRSIFSDCSHCRGSGYVKTSESLSIDAMRLLQLAAYRAPAIAVVQVSVHIDVAHYLLNKRRKDIAALEERGKLEIQITGQTNVSPDTLAVRCFDHNNNEVRLIPPAPLPKLAPPRFGGRGERERSRDRGDRDRERHYPQPLD